MCDYVQLLDKWAKFADSQLDDADGVESEFAKQVSNNCWVECLLMYCIIKGALLLERSFIGAHDKSVGRVIKCFILCFCYRLCVKYGATSV